MNKLDQNYEQQLVAHLDQLTKQGQRLQVLKEISPVIKAGPSVTLRPQLARLANRNQAHVLALRILHPLIRDDRENLISAGPEVLNIYATSLMWIGALEEAQECLHRIKGSADALLTESFVHFARWDYQKAIPLLLKYVNAESISPYQKLVGEINLLAAHIAVGNLHQAKAVFEPLIIQLKSNTNYKLLYGNCLELRSQIEILEKSYDSALAFLNESEKCLSDQPGRYLLYVNKWRALAKLELSPKDHSAQQALLKVKAEATELKNWETIRDCDFHLARITNDQNLMQRILLGTPYQGYHNRIQSIFGISASESKILQYCPSQATETPGRIALDLNQISDTAFLNSTSWPLLQTITKDIYRPPRMGAIFNNLYKNEYFDPYTSPQRVRNSVFRFNDWASEKKCDFRIRIDKGNFQLTGPEGLGVSITQNERPLNGWQASLKLFKVKNDSKSFTSAEIAKVLEITPRSALSLLQKALAANKIEKIGNGKNSRYIFFSGRRAKRTA